MATIRDRILRLEKRRRFMDWFVRDRLYATLTADELQSLARDGEWPDPIPNRPSSMDQLGRKSLLKLWEEDERAFGGRSPEELEFYAKKGFWPEQRGRLHYSMQDGNLSVEWRNETVEG
jgi:hypothetical protein